jgi:ubiquinone/menaquinone biosynthesis C-methylase UbiE
MKVEASAPFDAAPSDARIIVMTTTETDADRELKAKHRTMWGLGNYTAVATEVIASLGPTLVEAAGTTPGQRVLDVAAGAGNVAIPAARLGAAVTASDLSPDLLARGKAMAEQEALSLAWEEADAEALPYGDASFDSVLSCVGVMFAPHHQEAADELVRVTRPGGTIGLISWTPEGFIGQMFAVMKPFAPPPPLGAQPPPLWGSESHVRELFGGRVAIERLERRSLEVPVFASGAEFRDYFKANYGPTIVTYRHIAEDADRVAELDAALADLGDRALAGGSMAWEYLLMMGKRV